MATMVRTGHPVVDLLTQARECLAEAAVADAASARYASAHLAALRAGAAVLAARGRDAQGRRARRGPRNVWVVLARLAPELAEWAEFFAATARKRPAAQAGVAGVVSPREADDLLRDADAFCRLVCVMLGLPVPSVIGDGALALAV